jgi:hypothetical protein
LTPEKIERFLIWENNFQNYVNNQRFEFNKELIISKFEVKKEKILISVLEKYNQQPAIYNANTDGTQVSNLIEELNKIKSSKTYKLWQAYCRIRDKILSIFISKRK